ncbi:MAG: glutamate racemase [Zetaproteobacteria bacterium CG12_big_fil_rev_8_21_14_0_65_54_13]|nr:MAG: glutamate racemase [Zetaproteobacteria bacterium CG23_combo_of_CG06-09_8_20_14_all_54_7]PIW47568.1 MAG: glutamate racemase [Zetaproteobacteria bacterium CG12_big_fil_rev_8_21_14_0_65_54_13]PIX53923.1 MAG: glutamate racemase [Zetaproteobacteria bacterium CG_4_10_14_3_um_filter_54_28]PJA30092.1 MAG: glutamate racemase [Zetaproteobacteria bacterium CG_4_9_14_3_um_filter_54_145]
MSDMHSRRIGVFDSGVGGLSVLAHIHRLLPHESLIYVADTAYIPYGCKPPEQVLGRCLSVADFLAGQQIKALVVACNTATAVAIETLRQRFSMPVIGMEPAIKPAALSSRSGVVGVLATTATLGSGKFNGLKSQFEQHARILLQPCPGLVEQVEQGDLYGEKTRLLLVRYLQPLLESGIDTLVLGCTHYPFLLPLIRQIVGDAIEIIDTGGPIARQLQRQLEMRDLRASAGSGTVEFWSSGECTLVEPVMSQLWQAPVTLHYLSV